MNIKYINHILGELHKMERWSEEYHDLLLHFSKFLRNKIWKELDDESFYKILSYINSNWLTFPCNATSMDNYIELLGNVYSRCNPHMMILFEKEKEEIQKKQEEIQKKSAMKVIREQWKDIYASKNKDYESLLSTFDLFYNQCVLKYPDLYIVDSISSAHLYRACTDLDANRDRFIPWPNKAKNRWNPEGKTYLYLSYGTKDQKEIHGQYTVNQHTCMEEIRGKVGDSFALCRFIAKPGLRILDLSYNDISFDELKNPLDQAKTKVEDYFSKIWIPNSIKNKKIVNMSIQHPEKFGKYLWKEIWKISEKENLEKLSYYYIGRTYLKLICDTIFQPIDDECDKSEQYHSFWDMANYLEEKKFDGIIYPSTRMALKDIQSKNLVLFDIRNAEPDITTKEILTLCS